VYGNFHSTKGSLYVGGGADRHVYGTMAMVGWCRAYVVHARVFRNHPNEKNRCTTDTISNCFYRPNHSIRNTASSIIDRSRKRSTTTTTSVLVLDRATFLIIVVSFSVAGSAFFVVLSLIISLASHQSNHTQTKHNVARSIHRHIFAFSF
jgi:hypothetical protein